MLTSVLSVPITFDRKVFIQGIVKLVSLEKVFQFFFDSVLKVTLCFLNCPLSTASPMSASCIWNTMSVIHTNGQDPDWVESSVIFSLSTRTHKSSNRTVHQDQVVNCTNPTETSLHLFPKALQSRSPLEPLNRQIDNGSTIFRTSAANPQMPELQRNGQHYESTKGMVRDHR